MLFRSGLLVTPAIVSMTLGGNDGARVGVSLVALAIIIFSLVRSRRKATALA